MFVSFLACFVNVHCLYLCLLRLRLVYLSELSALLAFFVACSVYVCCLYLVHSICICCALVTRLLYLYLSGLLYPRLLSVPHPLCLYLLCFGKLFAPFASSMTCSVCVYCLCFIRSVYICFALVNGPLRLRLPWLLCLRLLCMPRLLCLCLLCLSELSAPFTSSMALFVCICSLYLVYSVCVCYALVSYLLHQRLSWLVPFMSIVCVLSALSASTVPRSVVCYICIFRSLLRLHLLCMLRPLYLHLLYLAKSSAPSVSSVAYSICVCYLCLVHSVCILSFIVFIVSCME